MVYLILQLMQISAVFEGVTISGHDAMDNGESKSRYRSVSITWPTGHCCGSKL